MKSMKKLAAALSALGLLAAAAPSFAIPTLTFTDSNNVVQTVDPFGGFDWQSNATAYSTAPVYDNSTILTTTYLASATQIKLVGGADGAPSTINSTYEFTIKATIFETAECLSFTGAVCDTAKFFTTSGMYEIFYDSSPDANIVAGTGYLDGTKVISGSINPGVAGTFTLTSPTSGAGVFRFTGDVSFTNLDTTSDAYFNPALDTTNAVATLQIGGDNTDWTAPSSSDWGDGGTIGATDIVFQADGNQTFRAAVPEPASLALVGLSLLGLAATRRLRAK